jgi:hypothetical protein
MPNAVNASRLATALLLSALCGCNPPRPLPVLISDSGPCGAFGDVCCSGSTCNTGLTCTNGACAQVRMGESGKPCTNDADCMSGVCLSLDNGLAVCTELCADAGICVPGWMCGSEQGETGDVCLCTPSAEICDGKDNDCNGIVDDEPTVDEACAQSNGTGSVCTNGMCSTTEGCQSDADCVAGQTCDTTTHQCEAVAGGTDGGDGGPTQAGDAGDSGSPETGDAGDGGLIGEPDSGMPDSGPPDSGLRDGGTGDGGLTDGGSAQICFNPDPVQFNGVTVGSSSTIPVTITNCGTVDLTVSITLENSTTTTLFTASSSGGGGLPALPFELLVGVPLTINVTYTPVTVGGPPAAPDTGVLDVTSTNQTFTLPLEGYGEAPSCTPSSSPTASIQTEAGTVPFDPAATNLAPNTLVTLDGTASAAPAPDSVTVWSWRLVSGPSSASLLDATQSKAYLDVQAGGDYTVELLVQSSAGCWSAPVDVTIHVNATAAIHIQLTWPESYGDLDLHYIGPGGHFYETTPYPGDLDWEYSLATAYGTEPPTPTGSTSPDWGGPGTYPNGGDTVAPDNSTVDDPEMDLDQRQGYGPENISHNNPFDGTYTITAHYYCGDDSSGADVGPATAVVTVFVRGTMAWSGMMPNMQPSQAWDAAQIVVSNGGQDIAVVPLSGGVYATNEGCVPFASPDAGI